MLSVTNSTSSQLCSSYLVRNSLKDWEHEMSQNKIIHPSLGKNSFIINRLQLGDLIESQPHAYNSNRTSSINEPFNYARSAGNVYLFLISVSLISFFICLVVPLLLIKSNKNSKKIFKGNSSRSSQNNFDNLEEINSLNDGNGANASKKNMSNTNEIECRSENDMGGFMSPKRFAVTNFNDFIIIFIQNKIYF
jgi:hypothetical protein